MNCSLNNCVFSKMNSYRLLDQFTDVTFIIHGTRLKAHRNVLSCRSDVFEIMFTCPMAEAACHEVVITDASKEAFELFLQYLYLNTFDSEKTKGYYEEILYLAEKYFVEGLRYRCVVEIENLVASGNLVYMLKVADTFSIKSLVKKVVDVLFKIDEEFFASKEWHELSANFNMNNKILSNMPSSTVSMNWSGSLLRNIISQPNLTQMFTIRNNGNRVQGRVAVLCNYITKRLAIYVMLIRDNGFIYENWDRPIEISYKIKVLTHRPSRVNCVLYSGEGNHWWPAQSEDLDFRVSPELRRTLCDVEIHNFDIDEDTLSFSVTLTQWDPLNRVYKKQSAPDHTEPQPPKQLGSSTTLPTSEVGRFYATVKKANKKPISRHTYEKIRRYWATRSMPGNASVNLSLIYAARDYSCTDLQHHCEKVVASKLSFDEAVQTLILAEKMSLRVLQSKTEEFIVLNHLEVMATNSWNKLANHPHLVSSILMKVLSKPPDFEPLSKTPYQKLNLPGDESHEDSFDEAEFSFEDSSDSDSAW